MKTNFFPIHTPIIVNKHILIDDYQQSSIQNYPYNRHSLFTYTKTVFFIHIISSSYQFIIQSSKIHKIFIFYQKSHTIHQHILFTAFFTVLPHFYSILYRKTYLKKFFMLKNTPFYHIYTNVFKIIPFPYIC